MPLLPLLRNDFTATHVQDLCYDPSNYKHLQAKTNTNQYHIISRSSYRNNKTCFLLSLMTCHLQCKCSEHVGLDSCVCWRGPRGLDINSQMAMQQVYQVYRNRHSRSLFYPPSCAKVFLLFSRQEAESAEVRRRWGQLLPLYKPQLGQLSRS